MVRFRFACLGILTGLLTLSGCGGSSDLPSLGTVDGVVKLDGEPLEGVQVTFAPADKEGRVSFGMTDDSGYYSLKYSNNARGAVLGTHEVTMLTPLPGDLMPDEKFVERVPKKYQFESTLIATVDEGSNEIDFDLESY
ncbi:hypothetical protein KOR42_53730 [Thalassoglobus neptunius]|uniref:Carboxypeptidase regulatory-like domain-containing protein n=1 Tax=Thalassoglobus neptunius TaxID=1938619 RepID=A0A5C5V6C8_9PLAN|nr:carboxypeptidase regulatory-like domain-containing protein [Thalassoglobus neptunius]TWT34098.1 hypothetical protein KOR42_53730 [Thalassoglobus neptunius]